MELYKKRYRIQSIRATWWDYQSSGAYFITICTKNRERFFGNVRQETMHLSTIGQFAQACWHEIPQHYPDVELGAFVVMPDHIHGIIIVNRRGLSHDSMPKKGVFGPQSMNLGAIVRGYKVGVSKSARSILPDFAWQSGYYDCIIRNNDAYRHISDYIINNPKRWGKK